ncbi:MAG: hypothetical protein OHK0026_07780 [Rhodocyclaceae bacterium]
MQLKRALPCLIVAAAFAGAAQAQVPGEQAAAPGLIERSGPIESSGLPDGSGLLERYVSASQAVAERAMSLIGIRYRRGGNSPETGLDCSGLVRYVFRGILDFELPRRSKDISRVGEPVDPDRLRPGDLVFFNTVRNAVSHVGIYLGDFRFLHAPRTGKRVRLEDMREHYWKTHFEGARRLLAER